MTGATAFVALVGGSKKGLQAIDNWYRISVEDFGAFTRTGEFAAVPPPTEEGLRQEADWENDKT